MDINGGNKREIKTNLDRSISSLEWSKDGKRLFLCTMMKEIPRLHLRHYMEIKNLVDNVGATIGRPYGGGSYSVSNKINSIYFNISISSIRYCYK